MAKTITTLADNLHTSSVTEGISTPIATQYNTPRDHMNPGEVLAAALGACTLTMVGYAASKRGDNATGTKLTLDPTFDEKHTRIVKIGLEFNFPSTFTPEQKKFYVNVAKTCPVHNSLREDIEYTVTVK